MAESNGNSINTSHQNKKEESFELTESENDSDDESIENSSYDEGVHHEIVDPAGDGERKEKLSSREDSSPDENATDSSDDESVADGNDGGNKTKVSSREESSDEIKDFKPRVNPRESEIERLFNTLVSTDKQPINSIGGDNCLFKWTDKNKSGKGKNYLILNGIFCFLTIQACSIRSTKSPSERKGDNIIENNENPLSNPDFQTTL